MIPGDATAAVLLPEQPDMRALALAGGEATMSLGEAAHVGMLPARSAERRGFRASLQRLVAITALLDLLTITAAACIAWELRWTFGGYFTDAFSSELFPKNIAFLVPAWLGVLAVRRAYSLDVASVGVGYGEYSLIVRCSMVAVACVGFAGFVTKSTELSRGYLVLALVVGIPMLLFERFCVRRTVGRLRERGRLCHRAVVVGPAAGVSDLLRTLRREAWTGYGIVGVCVPEDFRDSWSHDVPVLGVIGDLADVVRRENADTVVVVGGSYHSAADLRRVSWELEGQDVDLLVAPTLTDVAGPRVRMRHVAGLPLVHVAEPPVSKARGPLKRVFDTVFGIALIVALSPVLLVLALAIKLHDGGPVFYRQTRVGVLGRHFSMVKFRSMVPDADQVRAELDEHNEVDGVLFKMKEDPRITPIGRFLRKHSLDELPQLFNVVRGEMSLVGPRPALPEEVAGYEPDMRRRLLVQPGLTGLWQVSGRSDLSWEEATRLDLYYVDNWSMMTDMVILAKTAGAVVRPQGAY